MNTDVMPDPGSGTRKIKVVYKVQSFYAYCPSCEISRQCKHESDGTYTLVCGCRRDGFHQAHYLINASDIHIRESIKIIYVDVPTDDPFVSEWR